MIDIFPSGVRNRQSVRLYDVVVDVVLPELSVVFRDASPLSRLTSINENGLADRAGLFGAGGAASISIASSGNSSKAGPMVRR